MISCDSKRGLSALIIVLIVLSVLLPTERLVAAELRPPILSYDVSIAEAVGVPSNMTPLWLLPPEEPFQSGVLVADRFFLGSLEKAGATIRILAEYIDHDFYYLASGSPFVSEGTLSGVGTILWNRGDMYLVHADESIADRLKLLGFGIQLLVPSAKNSAPHGSRPPASALSSNALPPLGQPFSPVESYCTSKLVGSVSTSHILGRLNSLTGEEPVSFRSGFDTLTTRYSYSPRCSAAAEYIHAQFDSMGLDVSYDSYFGVTLRAVAFVGSAGYAAGSEGNIFRTSDGGESWKKCGWRSNPELWKACFIAPDSGWICGSKGCVLRTIDGGATWDSLGSPTSNYLCGVKFVNSKVGWVCGSGGTVRKTTDGGATWVTKTCGSLQTLWDVEFTDLRNGWMVANDGVVLHSSDGGDTWSSQTISTQPRLYDVCFVDSLRGWAVGSGGTILRTRDGGTTWEAQSSGVTSILESVCFADSLRGWAVGTYGIVVHTSDGGATWTVQNSAIQETLCSACCADSLHVWAVGLPTDIHTTDGGLNWLSSNENFPGGWRNVVATLPGTTNPEEVYLVCAHYDSYSASPMVNAPGADDNATGTSLVLEAAKALAGFAFFSSIRFACFSGEEQGLLGSANYAAEAASRGDNIAGVLNFDMIGHGTRNCYLITNSSSEWLVDYCIAVRDEFVPQLSLTKLISPSMRYSDHASFWDQGYSALCGIETDYSSNPYYHSIGDTVGNLDLSFTTNVTKLAVASLAFLAGIDITFLSSPLQASPSVALYLGTGFPNPFNPSTRIPFAIPATERPTNYVLAIFDPAGRMVKILEQGQTDAVGASKTSTWDGKDEVGRPVSSGVYVCYLGCGDDSRVQKIVLLR